MLAKFTESDKEFVVYGVGVVEKSLNNCLHALDSCGVQRGAVSRAASVMYRGTIDDRHVFVGGVLGFGW